MRSSAESDGNRNRIHVECLILARTAELDVAFYDRLAMADGQSLQAFSFAWRCLDLLAEEGGDAGRGDHPYQHRLRAFALCK